VTIPACTPTISADHPVGSRTAQVTVTVVVTCHDEVYDRQAALRLAAISFTQETTTALGASYTLVVQATTALLGVAVTNVKRGTLTLSIEVGGMWVYQWSPARLEALAKRIAGVPKQAALALLQSLEGVQSASIHLAGSEKTTLPTDPNRIIISVASARTG